MLPQCTIGRIGIGIEFRRQFLDVEIGRQLSRVRVHAVILFGETDMPFSLFRKARLPLQFHIRNTSLLIHRK